MYDLIGDIHGHAGELLQLLEQLGYTNRHGYYSHPDRTVLFVGDFIDRGPEIREVLGIVRDMIENGSATAVMGNHEFNAIAYQTERRDNPGTFLRRHNNKNTQQHLQTLRQLGSEELKDYVEWFRTLPPWIILDGLRVVHAAWSPSSVAAIETALTQLGTFSDGFMQLACTRGTELFQAVEDVLKGKELELPDGVMFQDKDGHVRQKMRVKWYASPENQTYRSYSFPTDPSFPDVNLPPSFAEQAEPYPPEDRPVFFGHYWLTDDRPSLLADNVACLDYSVAKNGYLCAYRWNAKQPLDDRQFVTMK